jgi:hypothetical protein
MDILDQDLEDLFRKKLDKVIQAIRASWSEETASQSDIWTEENPARGQCAVSSLIIQDYFGGQLGRVMVGDESHYFNILFGHSDKDGIIVDITAEQFTAIKVDYSNPIFRTREYTLSNEHTKRRYETLKARVEKLIGQ